MAMVQVPSMDMACFSLVLVSARGACQELLKLDDSAAVASFHQHALALANLDCEADAAAFDGDHRGLGDDRTSRLRRGKMVDLDAGAYGHLARFAIREDGAVRGVLEISHKEGRPHHLDAGVAGGRGCVCSTRRDLEA